MVYLSLFALGAIIGSFLNVLALRFNSGLTLFGRSHCPSCGQKLGAGELVPILSYFFLKGRCRGCQAKISWQYPVIEIWTGLVFLSIFNFQFSILQNLLLLTVFSLYIAITIYDVRHQIIPDKLVYLAIILSILYALTNLQTYQLIDFFAGPLLALFFALVWLASRGRAMGFGDAKLALSIGFLLGAAQGFSAIVLSFWIGAAFGILLMFFSRPYPLSGARNQITIKSVSRIGLKSAIPFAPFIVIGAWLAQIWRLDLLHVSLF